MFDSGVINKPEECSKLAHSYRSVCREHIKSQFGYGHIAHAFNFAEHSNNPEQTLRNAWSTSHGQKLDFSDGVAQVIYACQFDSSPLQWLLHALGYQGHIVLGGHPNTSPIPIDDALSEAISELIKAAHALQTLRANKERPRGFDCVTQKTAINRKLDQLINSLGGIRKC